MMAVPTSAGKMRRQAVLESPQEVSDGAGGYSLSWQEEATLWAEMRPLSGKEKVVADKLQASLTHRVVLRYRDGVTPQMRLQMDGRYFNIRRVINVEERNEFLELLVEEGVGS